MSADPFCSLVDEAGLGEGLHQLDDLRPVVALERSAQGPTELREQELVCVLPSVGARLYSSELGATVAEGAHAAAELRGS